MRSEYSTPTSSRKVSIAPWRYSSGAYLCIPNTVYYFRRKGDILQEDWKPRWIQGSDFSSSLDDEIA